MGGGGAAAVDDVEQPVVEAPANVEQPAVVEQPAAVVEQTLAASDSAAAADETNTLTSAYSAITNAAAMPIQLSS